MSPNPGRRPLPPEALKPGREAARERERRYKNENRDEINRRASERRRRLFETDATFREEERLASAAYRREHPREVLRMQLKRNYALSLEEFERLETAQGGLCAICGKPETGKSQT